VNHIIKSLDGVTFDYAQIPVSMIKVDSVVDPTTHRRTVTDITVRDEQVTASPRFMNSLCSRFQFSNNIFNFFDFAEVFDRIAQTRPNAEIRVCIERREVKDPTSGAITKHARLLAVSNPAKPYVDLTEVQALLLQYGAESSEIQYHDGIIASQHTPRASGSFTVGRDTYTNRFAMFTPLDGYGLPVLYLSLFNKTSAANIIGYSNGFRSQVTIGKANEDVKPSLIKVLDSFNNEEGYSALRDRLVAASKTPASVAESNSVYKLLVRCLGKGFITDSAVPPPSAVYVRSLLADHTRDVASIQGGGVRQDYRGDEIGTSHVLRAFHRMTGDTAVLYGLANIDSLSKKKQRTLPTRCYMYDVLKLLAEIAAHYTTGNDLKGKVGARMLHEWIGPTLSSEYDLEGTDAAIMTDGFRALLGENFVEDPLEEVSEDEDGEDEVSEEEQTEDSDDE
jgi:hypothetical protein